MARRIIMLRNHIDWRPDGCRSNQPLNLCKTAGSQLQPQDAGMRPNGMRMLFTDAVVISARDLSRGSSFCFLFLFCAEPNFLKAVMSTSQLHRLHAEKAVLVLGLRGAGKSTLIGIQQGAVYEKDGHLLDLKLCTWPANAVIPQASDRQVSKTLNIGVHKDPVTKRIYLDTAGKLRTRAPMLLPCCTFTPDFAW